jgi:hypothetical protein
MTTQFKEFPDRVRTAGKVLVMGLAGIATVYPIDNCMAPF